MLSSAFFSGETPERKNRAVVMRLGILSGVFVVLVIVELFLIGILNDHSFHNFEGSLHGGGVKWILHVLLLLLHWLLVLGLALHLFLQICSLQVFPSLHVGVEDHPLSGFQGKY
jgi:hypothetical protein